MELRCHHIEDASQDMEATIKEDENIGYSRNDKYLILYKM